ncbi:MAG: hypothetical protein JXR37_36595 [Kiritimatiellae bacterium]|nr:hypothetical protein [Kiritimatiellia bacterium]
MRKRKRQRRPGQTATAISMSEAFYDAVEEGRKKLQMDRSNFIRYCVAKELEQLGISVSQATEKQ